MNPISLIAKGVVISCGILALSPGILILVVVCIKNGDASHLKKILTLFSEEKNT